MIPQMERERLYTLTMFNKPTKSILMKKNIKYIAAILFTGTVFFACDSEEDYSMGELTPPSNIVIQTEIVGQDEINPNGDGSGDVIITVTASNAITYKIDFDANTPMDLVHIPTGTITKKYTTEGTNSYRITAVVYGKGGSSSIATKDITIRSDFNVDPEIVTNLTNNATKTWVVDKSVPGHLGVGPWATSSTPEWWSASIDEKVACCNCFYTATFAFTKTPANTYTIDVSTPDGAFTKTGSLANIPGIPATGDEGCYSYGGGSSAFSFTPATSGISASTQTIISLGGSTTFIGYGALQKEYEIIELTSNYMYLRVQGTETGNAWYLKLKPAP